jgi:hypothetical protein
MPQAAPETIHGYRALSSATRSLSTKEALKALEDGLTPPESYRLLNRRADHRRFLRDRDECRGAILFEAQSTGQRAMHAVREQSRQ